MRIGLSTGCLICVQSIINNNKAKNLIDRSKKDFAFLQGLAFKAFVESNTLYDYIEDPWPDIRGGDNGNEYVGADWVSKLLFVEASEAIAWRNRHIQKGSLLISHKIGYHGNATLFELGRELSINRYQEFYGTEKRALVYDTLHAHEQGVLKQNDIRQIALQIALVHVQPTRNTDEWEKFLNGGNEKTYLELKLRNLVESGYDGDYVIEVNPRIHNSGNRDMTARMLSSAKLFDSLLHFRDRVEEVLRA